MIRAEQLRTIFVGRVEECAGFSATLSELTIQRPHGWLGLWRRSAGKVRARAFVIQGSGGVGKSTLVRRFGQLTKQSGVGWALCNWENARDAGTLPADLLALLSHLHNALVAELGGPAAAAFEDFRALQQKHTEIKSKAVKLAAEVQPKYEAAVSAGAKAVGGLVSEVAPPGTRAIAAELAKSGVELAGKGIAAVVAELATRLSSDEFNLVTKAAELHANEFVKALIELGEKTPVVLAQDTCELADRENLQGEFRSLVVRPCLQKSSEIVFVMAARSNLGKAYAKAFEDSPHLVQDSVLDPFSVEEVSEFLAASNLPREWAAEAHAESLGLPYVLPLVVIARAGDGTPAVGVENVSDVPLRLVERVLSDVIESPSDSAAEIRRKGVERYRLYSLALVRGQDTEALRACWAAQTGAPVSDDDIRVAMASLRRANAFIFEENADRLLGIFREGARRYIRLRIASREGWLDEADVRKLNQAALDSFQSRLKDREAQRPTRAQRMDDSEWKRLAAGALSQQFWLDEDAATRMLCWRLLASTPFDAAWAAELVAIAGETAVRNSAVCQAIAAGVQDWTADPGTDLPLLAMWDQMAELLPKWTLPPEARSLLALQRARTLFRLKRYDEALQEAEAGLKSLPADGESALRERLVTLLTARAVQLVQSREYGEAVAVSRRALARDPGNEIALRFLVMALGVRKDFAAAHEAIDAYAARFPELSLTHEVRANLLWIEGRDAEALAETKALVAADPGAITELAKRSLAGMRDRTVGDVMTQMGRDSGLEEQRMDVLERMTASPDAAVEILAASMKLLATENPSIEDVLRVRKLTVEKFQDWAEVRIEYGAALLAAGQTPAALEQFARARELAPSATASLQQAEVMMLYGLYEQALPICEETASKFPANVMARVCLIKCLYLSGKLEAALETGSKALEDFPQNPLLQFQVGSFLLASDQKERGWQLAHEGYVASPEQILGQLVFNLRTMAATRPDTMRQLIEKDTAGMLPEARKVLLGFPPDRLVVCYVTMLRAGFEGKAPGEPAVASLIPVWEEIQQAKPEELSIRLTLAGLHLEIGGAQRAAELLEGGLASAPPETRSALHIELADVYRSLDRPADELRHLRQAQDHLQPAGLRYLARMMVLAGEPEAALATWDKAGEQEPDPDFDNRLLFSQVCLGTRRFARALEMSAALGSERPGNPDATQVGATALYYLGRFEECAELAKEGSRQSPGEPALAAVAARALEAIGDPAAAGIYRARALALLGGVSLYNQACALSILGRTEDALTKLALAVNEDPTLVHIARLEADFLEMRGTPAFEAAFGAAALKMSAGSAPVVQ